MAKAFDLRVGIYAATTGTRYQIPSWGLYKARTRITLTHPPICTKTHRLKPVGQFSASIPALGSRQLVPLPADPALLFLLGGQLCEQKGEADQASAAIVRPEASQDSWHFLATRGQVKSTPKTRMGRWNCVITLYDR